MIIPSPVDPRTLPGKTSEGGHVYLLNFDNGTVKVGSTVDPQSRITKHLLTAAGFGITLTGCWLSRPVNNHLHAEGRLVDAASAASDRVIRQEWFQGVDYDALVARAPQIVYRNRGRAAKKAPPIGDPRHDEARPKPNAMIAALLDRTESDEDREALYQAWLFNRRRFLASEQRRARKKQGQAA